MTISGPVRIVTPSGQVLSQGSVPMDADAQLQAQCADKRIRERVAGFLADFYHVCFGRHYTGAWWLTRSVYVAGDAADVPTAELQEQVYRSVRFAVAER